MLNDKNAQAGTISNIELGEGCSDEANPPQYISIFWGPRYKKRVAGAYDLKYRARRMPQIRMLNDNTVQTGTISNIELGEGYSDEAQ